MPVSCIYTITAPSGKSYVGSAVDKRRRWALHIRQLNSGKHGNCNLVRAASKYGIDSLVFSVLFVCRPDDLIFFEQRAIDILKPEYNIAPIAGNGRGIVRSKEFREKVSRGGKGRIVSSETRALIGAKHKGKKLTPDQIRRWREAIPPLSIEQRRELSVHMHTPEAKSRKAKAMIGHKVSSETRAKISASLLGRRHSPERIAAITAGKVAAKDRAAITLQNGA